jgi:hypothetical protein
MESATQKTQTLTLKGYFKSLSDEEKQALVRKIADRAGCKDTTARQWCYGSWAPRLMLQKKILSKITGISVENLFEE